jgi:hypothetical protein
LYGSTTLGWGLLVVLLCGFDLPSAPPLPFQVGEELTFEVRWLGMSVGTAMLSVGQPTQLAGHEVVPLLSLTRSAPFFSTFYEVDDRVESYVDLQRLVPRWYRIRLKEGSYRLLREVTFDQEQHQATHSKNAQPPQTVPTVAAVQDALSALYVVRTLPLQVRASVSVPIFDRDTTWHTEIQVLARERLKLPFGPCDTLKVKPLLRTAGIFRREGELFVWLTDDKRRLPVQMQSRITIGTITARLIALKDAVLTDATGHCGP